MGATGTKSASFACDLPFFLDFFGMSANRAGAAENSRLSLGRNGVKAGATFSLTKT